MNTRESNTLDGVLKGLLASESITPIEKEAITLDLKVPYLHQSTYNTLVARFGLKRTTNGYSFKVPTERHTLVQ